MGFSLIDSMNQNIFGGVWTLGSHLGMLFALDPNINPSGISPNK